MEGESSSVFDLWKPLSLQPQVVSIIMVFIILAGFIIYYYIKMRKLDPKEPPKGIAFFIFNIINFFKRMVFETVGPRFVKITPYIITLFLYIAGCNLISMIGFENPTASTTVTFSMGIVSVVGTICVGIRYQKSRYFLRFLFKFNYVSKKTNKHYLIPYCINPFGFTDVITPILSISLRLWGNIFAGALIIMLIYSVPVALFHKDPLVDEVGPEGLLVSIIAAPFHGFLDLLIGVIQSFVFVVLTLSYWGNESTEEHADYDMVEYDRKIIEQGFDKWEKEKIQVELKSVTNIDKN